MSRDLTFDDAVRILGSDPERLHTVDLVLGTAISGVTAAHMPTDIVRVLRSMKLLADHSLDIMRRVDAVIRKTKPPRRHEVLAAAHAIVVVAAFYEAFAAVEPLFARRFGLAAGDQLALANFAGGDQPSAAERRRLPLPRQFSSLVSDLGALRLPLPSPGDSSRRTTDDLLPVFHEMTNRTSRFMRGLAEWDALDETEQSRFEESVLGMLPAVAVRHYTQRVVELATLRPEFAVWLNLTELQAAASERGEIRLSLDRIAARLEQFADPRPRKHLDESRRARRIGERLALAYRAELDRPLVATDEADTLPGLSIPTVREAYIDPAFRVARESQDARPAEERWWRDEVARREELADFLAWHLSTSPALEAPTLVLGHPGAGKSLFTKVLAAQTPSGAFAPVRVELRHVSADRRVLDQIEEAMRASLNETVTWADFSREAVESDRIPLVILDGLDELLQTGGMAKADYLATVAEFQRVEAVQERPVVVIVTSRTLVMSQASIPSGCTMIRIEPFDERRITGWVDAWNRSTAASTLAPGRPLDAEKLLRFQDLAEQPLLLLLLALYNAAPDSSWENGGGGGDDAGETLKVHGLYEGLLTHFARREVLKSKNEPDFDSARIDEMIQAELDMLSFVAFSMFNRGAQSVSLDALNDDLRALKGRTGSSSAARRVWSDGQRVVGRFFFIHEAQSGTAGGNVLRAYEFLHATFGEYLVARKILRDAVRITKLLAQARQVYGPQHDEYDDGAFHALMSFASLTSRGQVISFLREMTGDLPEHDREGLSKLILELFGGALEPRDGDRYGSYRPMGVDAPTRHAAYSINLLVIALAIRGRIPIRELNAVGAREFSFRAGWTERAHLWRACMPYAWRATVDHLERVGDEIALGTGTTSTYDFIVREAELLNPGHDSSGVDRVNTLRATEPLAPLFEITIVIRRGDGTPMRVAVAEAILALRLEAETFTERRELFHRLVAMYSRLSPELTEQLLAVAAADQSPFTAADVLRLISNASRSFPLLAPPLRLKAVQIAAKLLERFGSWGGPSEELLSLLGQMLTELFRSGSAEAAFEALALISKVSVAITAPDHVFEPTLERVTSAESPRTILNAVEAAIRFEQWEWLSEPGIILLCIIPWKARAQIDGQTVDRLRQGLLNGVADHGDPDLEARVNQFTQRWEADRTRMRIDLGFTYGTPLPLHSEQESEPDEG